MAATIVLSAVALNFLIAKLLAWYLFEGDILKGAVLTYYLVLSATGKVKLEL